MRHRPCATPLRKTRPQEPREPEASPAVHNPPRRAPLAWARRVLAKELLDPGRHLASARLAQADFTDRHATNGAATIPQIERRPILVAERPPVLLIVVQGAREPEPLLAHVRRHRRTISLIAE